MKQISQVLEAVQSGCENTAEIAKQTGLSVNVSSAAVSDLIKTGLLKRTDKKKRYPGRGGEYKGFELRA